MVAKLPETIGKYKILSLVAQGGMGAVYKAMHPTLKRHVIIKKLTIRGNTAITERFKREALILLDFNDPNIVHLFDYFKEGNSHYIVLEYVDGMSLDVLLKKRRYLSGPLSLYIFLEACKALKCAHEHGVIHRDIKPGNILISRKGAVKLADFGIAAIETAEEDDLTKEGVTLGTASYMPPEQFKNSKNVDKRADIYSMGVMLYEMVSGKRPFAGNFSPETILSIQKGKYTRLRKVNPDTPSIIARLVKKMIRPNPKRRYRDMVPVIKSIEKYLKQFQIDQIQESLVQCIANEKYEEPFLKPRKKKHVVALSLAVTLILLAGCTAFAWTQGYVHKTLLCESYGALKFQIRFPISVKSPEDILVKASLFIHDRNEFPEADSEKIVFTYQEEQPDSYAYRFESNTLYIKPGAYRAKITAEQRIYWHSFTVESIASRKRTGIIEQLIGISFDRIENQPLSVRTEAFDAISERTITSATRYSVFINGTWVGLQTLPENSLMAGQVIKFKAEHEGYYDEVFSLKISPYQSELVLRANLIPLPGTLSINAPEGRYRLSLNGSSTIILGGETMEKDSIAKYVGGQQSWSLPSGRYDIEVVSGKNLIQTRFDINYGETTHLRLSNSNGLLLLHKE